MSAQIAGVLRIILTSALAGLVAKGILTADQSSGIVEGLIGILGIVGLAVWSWLSNSMTALITKVASSEDVTKVVLSDPVAAELHPSPKVVAQ